MNTKLRRYTASFGSSDRRSLNAWPAGGCRLSTIIVITTASTPSLNASRRSRVIAVRPSSPVEGAKSAQVDAGERLPHDELREDALAIWAAQDDPGSAKDVDGADRCARAACGARSDRPRHPGAERLLHQARDCVAVEHECVHLQPPVGPKRSVFISCGSWPRPTSAFATASTNGVGPQT